MRSILLGTLAFIAWSVFGNYWYVCKIKGLCNEAPTVVENDQVNESSDTVISNFNASIEETEISGKIMDTLPNANVFETVYINFFSGSDSITNGRELKPVVDQLKEIVIPAEDSKILLVGHTDDQGEADFNYLLGLQRAQSFKKLLVNQGFDQETIHVASRGEKDPLVENLSEANRRKNRRVEILIF